MSAFKNHFALWSGLLLMIPSWIINWSLVGLRTHLLFFPLWLGYCLTMDGLVYYRTGTSLLRRSWKRFIGLFLISAPCWWLFELINLRTENWLYLGREQFTSLEYFLYASLNFSTVMPAVFETAEWVSSWRLFRRSADGHHVPSETRHLRLYFCLGWVLLMLLLMWPQWFYPFVWLAVYLIIDPINARLGARSLFDSLKNGEWRIVWTLWIGCLICGFFWELWNFHSFPKWIYHTPHVQFWHVFEMPLWGYSGYLPFSMELYALYHLFTFTIEKRKNFYLFSPTRLDTDRSGAK